MIKKRSVLWWVLLSGCLLSCAIVQAASGPARSAEKAAVRLDEKNVIHACARQSVPELSKKAQPFQQSIAENAHKFRVDADLIRAVIAIESCYKIKALSPKSAQGLMQLVPATAERFGVSDVYNAEQNIRGGAQYLGWLSRRFKGDLVKVLAGYNAGEGKVDHYDGIPPYRETRHYVHDVLVVYEKFKQHRKMMADAKARQQRAEQQRQRQIRLAQQRQAAQTRARGNQTRRQQIKQNKRKRPQTPQTVTAAKAKAASTYQIIIGQPSQPIRPPAHRPQSAPVLRKASARVVRSAQQTNTVQKPAAQRVKRVYASPFKPGRAGWQVNKRLAPQLYKR